MAKREHPSPDEVLSERVRHYRTSYGWSQAELAQLLSELGVPTHQTTVSKIEDGSRRVSIDEALALAAALAVPLPLLLVPIQSGGSVAVTPKLTMGMWDAVEWLVGTAPTAPTNPQGDDRWWQNSHGLWLFLQVRSDAGRASGCARRLRRLEERGAHEEADEVRATYRDMLRLLAEDVSLMIELGLPTDGLLAEPLLSDMDEHGIEIQRSGPPTVWRFPDGATQEP